MFDAKESQKQSFGKDQKKPPALEKSGGKRAKTQMVILLLRIFLALFLALVGEFWLTEDRLAGYGYPYYLNLILMGLAWLIVSYDVLFESCKIIVSRRNPFDERLLMCVSSIGAFCLRFFGEEYNECFEGVMVMLLYQAGEFFEDLAADKSRKAITEAIDLRSEKASVLNIDGSISLKSPEEIHIGDVVLLKVGDKCLSDGVVIEGEGNMDESSITGEFVPVRKEMKTVVLSGTILVSGSLKIQVSKEYEDSTVAKLLNLVETSAEKKSKTDRFVTRFARYYTPIVIVLALLVAIIPPLCLGSSDMANWERYIYVALCFLVISCPCAIVISVPLAYFAGLGLASKSGIIVKGAEYYDKLNAVKTIAFDKTGTLTKGEFKIAEVSPIGMGEEEFMDCLLAAEARSNHPIAQAICQGRDLGKYVEFGENYQELAGIGVAVSYGGHIISALNEPLLPENVCQKIGTIVYLLVDGADAGYVLLNDNLKPNAKSAIKEIQKRGIRAMLLSGDKKENVASISDSLGIDEFYAQLLPAQKLAKLEEKMAEKKGLVSFVGDGINDAPSIVGSDVGMGMGGLGSDIVVQNADIVFMNDDLDKVPLVFKIAKKTERKAIFNIIVSLSLKLAVMLLAFFWEGFPLWLATLADSGLAVLMILNSLLLLRAKFKSP